jgi:hypothetical protein
MDRTANVAIARDYRALRVTLGSLAMIAAAAAGAGTAITAALFGALIAFGLSAGAGLAALLEVTEGEPRRGWRVAAWAALVLGWIVVATLFLRAPLQHLDGLRPLISVLIAGGAALRAWRWYLRSYPAAGIACALSFALLAMTAMWGGPWLPVRDTATTAVSLACALELFGSGILWLAEGAFLHGARSVRGDAAPQRGAAVMPMAAVLAR